ncbi:ATP-dependent RNA helicase dbp6 [Haplosporangium sp. Z 767]|nr:ATP-dependent RNA helicase dbp6 [Haplosporangium sp. Z 11]KAF9192605.1 ATP-dependent RNA helicase dbp6 [Haplosporangium sp. Z 767]
MFNIKRYDVEADSPKDTSSQQQHTPLLSASERLAKLNARLSKNKKADNSSTETQESSKGPVHVDNNNNSTNDSKHSIPDGDTKRKSHSKDGVKEISYKRSREFEEAREAREEAARKHGKKWEKRAKELKDSDLIPNDVRMAMKAEAEAAAAAAKGIHPITPASTTAAAAATTTAKEHKPKETDKSDRQSMDIDEDMEDKEHKENMTTEHDPAQEDDQGIKQFVDDATMDAALADLALVPLPTFETKEISAKERERAKSMGIPDWLAHPTKIEPEINTPIDASMFGFSSRLIKQCRKAGIEECFAVQTAVIPVLMRARHLGDIRKAPGDLCVSAPTGSGKTLAYVLPIIEILSQRVVTRLRALVVLPTRDLCVQVKETFETFAKGTDLKIATSTGQNSFAHEQNILVGDAHTQQLVLGGHSRVDILITTPGRLIDHIKSTPNFTLQHLRFLVIDEADRLLNQSFQDWLYHILNAIHPSPERKLLGADGSETIQVKRDRLGFPIHDAIAPGFLSSFFQLPESDVEDPKALSVQKLLFSATLTRNPAKIASLQLSDPQYVAVQEGGEDGEEKQKYSTPAGLTEHMIVCDTSEKPLMVLHLLHHLQVRSALCFTKSVESAHRLYKLIQLYEKIRTTMPAQSSTPPDAGTKNVKGNKKMTSDAASGDEDTDDSNSDDDSTDSNSGDESDSSSDDEGEDDSDVEMDNVDVSMKGVSDASPSSSSSIAVSNDSTDDMQIDSAAHQTRPDSGAIVVAEYSSDLPKSKRQSILRAFNNGEIHLLICSDLISRGMDLAPVANVINYDVPVYMKKYIHRVGRTARAGKTGTAYSLVEMQEARHFKEMITKAGHWEKISRIKVKDQDVKDLVPGYTKSLAGLKDALVSSARAGKKGSSHGARRVHK